MHTPSLLAVFETEVFYQGLLANRSLRRLRINRIQIEELIGGLSNLLLEISILLAKPRFRLKFNDLFASDLIPTEMILHEVHYCTGAPPEKSRAIIGAITAQFLNAFQRYKVREPGRALLFRPFGHLQFLKTDVDHTYFLLDYRDPAQPGFGKFLLADKGELLSEDIDLSNLFIAALNRIRPFAERRRQQLEITVEQRALARGNVTALRRVFLEILFNIILFTPPNRYIRGHLQTTPGTQDIELRINSSDLETARLQDCFDRPLDDTDVLDLESGFPIDIPDLKKSGATLQLASAVGGGTSLLINFHQAPLTTRN